MSSTSDSTIKSLMKVGDNVIKMNESSPIGRFFYSLAVYLILAAFFGSVYWLKSTLNGESTGTNFALRILLFIVIGVLVLVTAVEAIFSIIYQVALFIQSIIHFKEGIFWSIITMIFAVLYFALAYVLFRTYIFKV